MRYVVSCVMTSIKKIWYRYYLFVSRTQPLAARLCAGAHGCNRLRLRLHPHLFLFFSSVPTSAVAGTFCSNLEFVARDFSFLPLRILTPVFRGSKFCGEFFISFVREVAGFFPEPRQSRLSSFKLVRV